MTGFESVFLRFCIAILLCPTARAATSTASTGGAYRSEFCPRTAAAARISKGRRSVLVIPDSPLARQSIG